MASNLSLNYEVRECYSFWSHGNQPRPQGTFSCLWRLEVGRPTSKAREKRPGDEVEWQPDPDIKPGYNVLVLSVFFSASVSLLLFKSSKYAFVRRVSVKRRAGVGAEAGSILFLRHAVLGLGLVSTLTLTLALKHTSLKKKR